MAQWIHFYATTNGVLGNLYRIYQYNHYPLQQPLCNGFYDMGEIKLGSLTQKAKMPRPEMVTRDSKYWLEFPGLSMHTDIYYWDFYIWKDPCLKNPYVYVDYHPPAEYAPPGFGYEFITITDEKGEEESIPSEDLTIYEKNALIEAGGKTTSIVFAKVELPGGSWLDKLNLSDPKNLIGIGILGFVGYEIFRGLKKR